MYYYLVFKYTLCKNGKVHTVTYSDLDEVNVDRVISRYRNNQREGMFYSLEMERGEMHYV